MHRILIVDDEPLIVDGLFDAVQEARGEAVELYRSYCARQALEIMQTTMIDVVVSDIRMPEMSGLELLERVKASWPRCRFIFLTGYDQFDYIYTAMQREGVSFLLKTEGYERIVEEIDRYICEIDTGYRSQALLAKAREFLREALPLLQYEYLTSVLAGRTETVDQGRLTELDLPLRQEQPLFLVVGLPSGTSPDLLESRSDLACAVRKTTEQHLAETAPTVSTSYRDALVWLVQPGLPATTAALSEDSFVRVQTRVKASLEVCQAIFRESLGVSVSFIVSAGLVEWGALHREFETLRGFYFHNAEDGDAFVLVDRGSASEVTGARAFIGAAAEIRMLLGKLDSLELPLDRGDTVGFRRSFVTLLAALSKAAGSSPILLSEIRNALSLFFLSYLTRNDLVQRIGPPELIQRLQATEGTWSGALETEMYLEIANSVFRNRREDRDTRAAEAVSRVQRHIASHLSEDISLDHLADIAFYHPGYLSRIFLQRTGMHLSDYLAQTRISKAKELLQRRALKIHEIGEAVGFRSPPYFTRFFKRLTGVSPQEYRAHCVHGVDER